LSQRFIGRIGIGAPSRRIVFWWARPVVAHRPDPAGLHAGHRKARDRNRRHATQHASMMLIRQPRACAQCQVKHGAGVIIWLHLRPRTLRWAMNFGTALFAACLCKLAAGSSDTSVAGASVAFTAAVLTRGWQEMAFFMGVVTGPRRIGSPEDVSE